MSGLADHPLAPNPPDPGEDPQTRVDAITRASGTSFGLGMKLLRRDRRRAMRAVYAFCRLVDDIADGDLPVADKRALLDLWRAEIDRLCAGSPRSAVGLALLRPVAAYDLPRAEFDMMIEGMEMDADGPVVAPPRARLERYIRCVAGTVGMLSMRCFGAWRGEISERFGLALARALQLTNILRDIEEDAAIGRLYLPEDALAAAGIPAVPDAVAGHPRLPDLCRALGAEARESYNDARAAISGHARIPLAPALAMMGVYERILDRLEAADWQRGARVTLSKPAKLWHGLRTVAIPATSG